MKQALILVTQSLVININNSVTATHCHKKQSVF